MKLLLQINQKASIKAGYEAPHSTMVIDLPVTSIPEDIRKYISDWWDPISGEVNDGRSTTTSKLRVTLPAEDEMVIAAMHDMVSKYLIVMAEADLRKEKERAEATKRTLAVLRERKTKIAPLPLAHVPAVYPTPPLTPDWPYDADLSIVQSPEALAWQKELDAHNAVLTAAWDERAKAQNEAARMKAAEKEAYIKTWITSQPAELQEQFADGLLDEGTTVELIANEAFHKAGLEAACEYEICADSKCSCRETGLKTLPPAVYGRWKAVKASLPKDTTVTFCEVCACLDDETGERESTEPFVVAKVTMPHGPFTFERTVQV